MEQQLRDLYAEKGSVWERMKELAFGEDGLRSEDIPNYDEAEARLEEIDSEIARLEKAKTVAERMSVPKDLPVAPEEKAISADERQAVVDARYETAFSAFIRRGIGDLEDEDRELLTERQLFLPEQRALAAGTDSAGGYTVPEGFWNEIIEARLAFGGILNSGVSKITTGDGGDLPIPTSDDTSNSGELLGENVQAGTQDVAFGQKVLGAYVWSSKIVRVSYQLLQDSAFNMDSFLARKFGERIGRVQSTYMISGTGTNQPEGILTGTTSAVTFASATVPTYAELVEIEHSVDAAYRGAGEYLISDDFLQKCRQLVDTTGRPLWVPGLTGGVPNSINGFKYTVDQNMPAATTGLTPLVFGDLSHYWVRDVKGFQVLRLTERYADYLQVGFLAFARTDARKVDAGNDPFVTATMN